MDSEVTYEIEGGIDFFKELKNITAKQNETSLPPLSLHIEDKLVEKCLISDEVLRKDHITLKCGHKFNYIPLFKEVVFQKCSMLPKNVSSKVVTMYVKNSSSPAQSANVSTVMYNSSYNLETTKVNYNEMKCPYCREITPQILPYYPYPDVSKIKYVNSPVDLGIPALTCEYNSNVDGATKCRTSCVYQEKYNMMLCARHFNKLETKVESESDTTISSIRTSRRRSAAKTISSDVDDKNVIISHNNPATTTCSFVLLSGPRKGCPCGKPMWIPKTLVSSHFESEVPQAAYCKVHYEKCIK
jgi:hypothetical protein